MSNCVCDQPPSPGPNVGGTLTGGIQDVSAVLPILGTEQCETHVGSALTGGFLYAAAAPLSIFGSLGIIKIAIGVLIASISIPKFWVSPHDLKPSGSNGKGKQSMICGAKLLQNTGFQLAGNVAPLIGMDGTCLKAESRLIEILKEKHINNPSKVRITWKSKRWNVVLILFTLIAAVMSGIPYFALLLGPRSWRPTTRFPWLFPFLRTLGSCLASVCCQFIIQSRVVSAMKKRILFMTIHRDLEDRLSTANKANLADWLKYHLQWDSDLPAEQSLRKFELALTFYKTISKLVQDVQPTEKLHPKEVVHPAEDHVSIDMEQENPLPTHWSSWMHRRPPTPLAPPPPTPLFQKSKKSTFRIGHFKYLRQTHFPSPKRDRFIAFTLWVVLLFSLPVTVVGYVGCFTLVSATPSPGSGPLVWLGLEAVLSAIRIFIWAWNPKFDEDTDVTVGLELDRRKPSDWAEELNGFVNDLESKKSRSLSLRPERQFLEAITTYTGPFDQFQRSDNIALYYTPMADDSFRTDEVGSVYITLLITVTDFNTGIGVTLLQLGGSFYYFDADVQQDGTLVETNATVCSTMRNIYPWQTQVGSLFVSLEQHYTSLVAALNQIGVRRDKLEWKWDLSIQPTLTTQPSIQPLFFHGLLHHDHRYEHSLKANLIQLWSRWISVGMGPRARDARNDCYEALEDETSEKAKWELTELDRLLAEEWVFREQVLVACSLQLEDILLAKINKTITELGTGQEVEKLKVWMRTGFVISRRKRLGDDRGEANKRMKEEMNKASALAERKRRSWKEQGQFAPKWEEGIKLIDALWSRGIDDSEKPITPKHAEAKIDTLVQMDMPSEPEKTPRHDFVALVAQRFKHWRSQYENERREMEATIECIRSVDGQKDQLDSAYEYPEPDYQAPGKFVYLRRSTSKGKACSAIVYDSRHCVRDTVFEAINKCTTRSAINVHPTSVASIPPNDNLLFVSCYRGIGEEPAFVKQNRDRWWDQQTSNSALFYFTPQGTKEDSCYISSTGPIAHILISLTTPSRVRLRLLHYADRNMTISVQQNGNNLFTLTDGFPKASFKLQTIEIGELRPGRHELQVVATASDKYHYYLRDILIDFLDYLSPSSPPAEEQDQGNQTQPTIDTSGGEHESRNSLERPLPLISRQNSGSEDHTVTRNSNRPSDFEPDTHVPK